MEALPVQLGILTRIQLNRGIHGAQSSRKTREKVKIQLEMLVRTALAKVRTTIIGLPPTVPIGTRLIRLMETTTLKTTTMETTTGDLTTMLAERLTPTTTTLAKGIMAGLIMTMTEMQTILLRMPGTLVATTAVTTTTAGVMAMETTTLAQAPGTMAMHRMTIKRGRGMARTAMIRAVITIGTPILETRLVMLAGQPTMLRQSKVGINGLLQGTMPRNRMAMAVTEMRTTAGQRPKQRSQNPS